MRSHQVACYDPSINWPRIGVGTCLLFEEMLGFGARVHRPILGKGKATAK